ncbi:hypothetical protein Lbir_0628 [Legionella birminghamensis]|uniref:Uncharacterized protein n=1 Tax=Legionella birminghamensis TaxID=28083 RepID=A0A378I9C5_9GAMM|nr:hypothetical protein [Legionella birminghamensis]KTC74838.1 hypothetical protein Lbir_0628 [Legionella birminghamensis]STX31739.1 Uncharacterised protein [Legionella birminghamensis]
MPNQFFAVRNPVKHEKMLEIIKSKGQYQFDASTTASYFSFINTADFFYFDDLNKAAAYAALFCKDGATQAEICPIYQVSCDFSPAGVVKANLPLKHKGSPAGLEFYRLNGSALRIKGSAVGETTIEQVFFKVRPDTTTPDNDLISPVYFNPLKEGKVQTVMTPEQTALLGQISQICADENFWSDKVRRSTNGKAIPAGVQKINEYIAQSINPFHEIIEHSKYKYSAHFQFLHSVFRGRADETNQFYSILSKLDIKNPASMTSVSYALAQFYHSEPQNTKNPASNSRE